MTREDGDEGGSMGFTDNGEMIGAGGDAVGSVGLIAATGRGDE